MKVVSYFNVVPTVNNNREKYLLLENFVQGVNAVGDTGILHKGFDVLDSDVGVIQGWTHEIGKSAPHLKLRQQVIDTQGAMKHKAVITADSNLFLYHTKTNQPHCYLRYSFNGVFPNTGNYCDTNPDPNRWQQIQNDLGVRLEEYKKGKHIVLCCQRNKGWSMGGYNVTDWIVNTVKEIRKYSDRHIIVRAHPGDKKARVYLNPRSNPVKHLPNVSISQFGTPLEQDLLKCYAVVNHNSSSIVGPIIKGYPAFVTDPERSQCAEVAHYGFEDIENPKEFDREKWLQRISMFHWKLSELQDGTCWRHMREFVQ
jgi:hypothetical protein